MEGAHLSITSAQLYHQVLATSEANSSNIYDATLQIQDC